MSAPHSLHQQVSGRFSISSQHIRPDNGDINPPICQKNPVYVTDVASKVKEVGGSIWLLEKQPFGFMLRCEIGPAKFRIVVRPINSESATEIPHEPNSPLHIVTTMNELRAWLSSLLHPIQ